MTAVSTLESRFVESKKGRIHYHEAGTGEALILIHGGGPGAYGYSNYRKNVGPLSQNHRVIVVDLPGFGQSDPRPSPDGLYTTLAEATLELIEHLGLKHASLVGNSLGGGTAIRLAMDHPTRVNRLILMGPGGSMPFTSTFPSEGLIRMITFYDGDGPSIEKVNRMLDLLVFDRSTITPELVQERYKTATLPKTMANPPLKGQAHNPKNDLWRYDLEKIEHKTLIIWGREDRVLPLDMAFMMLKRIPNADMHIYSKCGHWAQWERADDFNRHVTDFLRN